VSPFTKHRESPQGAKNTARQGRKFWILDFGFKRKKPYPNHNPTTIVILVRRMAKIMTEIQDSES
jgi:hypothetical protein